jgi:hypothetical protein
MVVCGAHVRDAGQGERSRENGFASHWMRYERGCYGLVYELCWTWLARIPIVLMRLRMHVPLDIV